MLRGRMNKKNVKNLALKKRTDIFSSERGKKKTAFLELFLMGKFVNLHG